MRFHDEPVPEEFPTDLGVTIFRLVQEATARGVQFVGVVMIDEGSHPGFFGLVQHENGDIVPVPPEAVIDQMHEIVRHFEEEEIT